MKAFTLLAVTGGLFFTSLCLNSKQVKNSRISLKSEVGHCIKKCCNHAKKAKTSNTDISKRAISARS
jgi:hypothetical protein